MLRWSVLVASFHQRPPLALSIHLDSASTRTYFALQLQKYIKRQLWVYQRSMVQMNTDDKNSVFLHALTVL